MKRYRITDWHGDADGCAHEDPEGEWVSYGDVARFLPGGHDRVVYRCSRCSHEADPACFPEPRGEGSRVLCEECSAYEAGAQEELAAVVAWLRTNPIVALLKSDRELCEQYATALEKKRHRT